MSTPDPRPAGTPGSTPNPGSLGRDRPSPPPATATGPATSPPTTRPAETTGSGRSPGRTIGRGLAAALLVFVTVVLVLFVMFNTQTVDISLVFTDVRAPLVVALLIAAALGGLIVGLLDAVMAVRRRRNR
ncbi:LapA family protein [Blastococcus sp. PRF04-17]|uniref:LapA family protein n=1 Tax=Blastococcus sp. PRF04-17 TaxID=2933797 RepID=UPI001FF53CCE|nr:LapA family protein [Blastococcus sp. PRF04-17]UOY00771.1 lipopolysaccharide assembly protein LapA domain-containing protein [Blastococcus sp. PRF04-17]